MEENTDRRQVWNHSILLWYLMDYSINLDQTVDREREFAPRRPARRGRKLGYRSSNTALEGADCQVCGAKAGRHSYYGAYTCKSCRAFFRRSQSLILSHDNTHHFRCVQRQTYHNLSCSGDLNCHINLETRKKCKACRWRACITAGIGKLRGKDSTKI